MHDARPGSVSVTVFPAPHFLFAKSGKKEMRWKAETMMSKCKHKGGPGELQQCWWGRMLNWINEAGRERDGHTFYRRVILLFLTLLICIIVPLKFFCFSLLFLCLFWRCFRSFPSVSLPFILPLYCFFYFFSLSSSINYLYYVSRYLSPIAAVDLLSLIPPEHEYNSNH